VASITVNDYIMRAAMSVLFFFSPIYINRSGVVVSFDLSELMSRICREVARSSRSSARQIESAGRKGLAHQTEVAARRTERAAR
jgi:hypothetical protein